jgi:hypothetical protein
MTRRARPVEPAGGERRGAVFTWQTLRASDGRLETVDRWPSLGAVIWEMACTCWEEPGNRWLSYVVDDATGEIAATAIFGPGLVLLVTVRDGRRLCFPVPESYREAEYPLPSPLR